jgi:hypothetical protein
LYASYVGASGSLGDGGPAEQLFSPNLPQFPFQVYTFQPVKEEKLLKFVQQQV